MKKDRSLAEAREWVKEHRVKGVECPCCDQFVKVYRRNLNATQIKTLRLLYEAGAHNKFIHAQTVLQTEADAAREIGKLAYFLLVRESKDKRPDGGRNGYWMVTDEGKGFLEGEVEVHKYVLVYNGEVLGYEGESIGIDDVAPRFNLRELLET